MTAPFGRRMRIPIRAYVLMTRLKRQYLSRLAVEIEPEPSSCQIKISLFDRVLRTNNYSPLEAAFPVVN